ncbi:putative dynamin GTPase [Helianthus annuus]|nr:putative dynamin GTPase [Helianthus annuus]
MLKKSSLQHSHPSLPPLIKELSENFKEPLDMIKKLEDMEVLGENPVFPNVVVLGEASAGASAVICTLVGLNLPSGLGFPVVLQFKLDSALSSRKIWLEFKFEHSYCEKELVSETHLENEILKLVEPLPEDKRSRIEITLTVIQSQVSHLTVILLPEIHTHPDNDKVKDKREMERFEGYINRYNTYNECLFLNVMSCSSNFKSCLSRKVLKRVDCFGTRTISIFTKLDLSLITQLTCNKIENTIGYFFVGNIVEDEERSEQCFLLSMVDQAYIGFDVISKTMVIAMLSILFNPRSLILKRIESDLEMSVAELKQCQKTFDSVSDATWVIISIVQSISWSIYKLFIEKDYQEYQDNKYMHAGSNMALRFRRFKTDLQELDNSMPFLQIELELLNSSDWPFPCIFVSSSIFKSLLNRQFSYASSTINKFVSSITDYIYGVVVTVLLDHETDSKQLRPYLRMIGRELVEGVRKSFKEKVHEMLDLEKKFHYTCSDDYRRKMNEMESVKLELENGKEFTSIEGIGNDIRVDHLKGYDEHQIELGFELKKHLVVYWEFVVNRFVDYCVLNLHSSIDAMITVGVGGVVGEYLKTGIKDESKLPDVEPIVAYNTAILECRVGILQSAKKDIKKWQQKFQYLL